MPITTLFVQEDAGRKGKKTDALETRHARGTRTPEDMPGPRGAVSVPEGRCLLASAAASLVSSSCGVGSHRRSGWGRGTPVSLCLFTRLAGMLGSETVSKPGDGCPHAPSCLPCGNRARDEPGVPELCRYRALRDLLSQAALAGWSLLPLPESPRDVPALRTSRELREARETSGWSLALALVAGEGHFPPGGPIHLHPALCHGARAHSRRPPWGLEGGQAPVRPCSRLQPTASWGLPVVRLALHCN